MARWVIGGTDVTDAVRAAVDAAPPLSPAQRDQIAGLFSGLLPRATAPITPIPVMAEHLPAAA